MDLFFDGDGVGVSNASDTSASDDVKWVILSSCSFGASVSTVEISVVKRIESTL